MEVSIKIPGSANDVLASVDPFWVPPVIDVNLVAPHGTPPPSSDRGYLGHPGPRVRLREALAGIPPPERFKKKPRLSDGKVRSVSLSGLDF